MFFAASDFVLEAAPQWLSQLLSARLVGWTNGEWIHRSFFFAASDFLSWKLHHSGYHSFFKLLGLKQLKKTDFKSYILMPFDFCFWKINV